MLKKTIGLIFNILYDELKPAIDEEYGWVKQWCEPNSIHKTVEDTYQKNIYISVGLTVKTSG